MKKILLGLLDKELTIDYVNNFLRGKGIATKLCDKNWLTFKLYDTNWDLFYELGRLNIRCSFSLGKETQMDRMIKATNAVNSCRFVVKSYIDETTPQDENSNPIKDAPTRTNITFAFENFCYTESAFKSIYEFAIYAIKDAIEYHCELYNQYLKGSNTRTSKIGFLTDSEQQDLSPAAKSEQSKKRIGFIQ